jgi:hypothetical protein
MENISTTLTISRSGGKDARGNKREGVKVDVSTFTHYVGDVSAVADSSRMIRTGERDGDADAITIGHAVYESAVRSARDEAMRLARAAANTDNPVERAAFIKAAMKGYKGKRH